MAANRKRSKELEQLFSQLEARGWRIDRSKDHPRAIPADKTKPIVVMAGTPSDHRSWKNMLSQLRRSGFNG